MSKEERQADRIALAIQELFEAVHATSANVMHSFGASDASAVIVVRNNKSLVTKLRAFVEAAEAVYDPEVVGTYERDIIV